MTRKETLQNAERCVCGQREEDYGSPEDNFLAIARLWTAHMQNTGRKISIDTLDVPIMMGLMKVARIETGTVTEDSFVDACGYLACAAEIATGTAAEDSFIDMIGCSACVAEIATESKVE